MHRSVPVTVWMLVRGSQATSDTWSALSTWGQSTQPTPAYLGDRWWLLAAENPLPLDDEILQALAGAEHALVLTQDSVNSWTVLLQDDGTRTMVSVAPDAPIDPAVAKFSRRRPPRQTRPRRSEAAEVPLPLKDAGAQWLKRCGWPVHSGIDPTRFLQGARANNPNGVSTLPPRVGERSICGEITRWVIDRVAEPDDGYGLWDRDNPDAPVMLWARGEQVWPQVPEGFTAAHDEIRRRVIHPILAATRLEGPRFWAPAPALNREIDQCGAVIAHMHPRGTLSVFQPWSTPSTAFTSRVGEVRLSPDESLAYDPKTYQPGLNRVVILDDVPTCLQVARVKSHPFTLGEWLPIPDDVPKGLLDTCIWVRTQAIAEGFAQWPITAG